MLILLSYVKELNTNTYLLIKLSFNMVCSYLVNISGDYGDNFYIILDGTVSILLPRKKNQHTEDLMNKQQHLSVDNQGHNHKRTSSI
jgi:hypothetical protein